MKKTSVLLGIACLSTLPPFATAASLLPDTGAVAIHQRTLELQSRLRVMMISLRPGEEDLETVAALRLGSGAHVLSVILTNGESGVHDSAGIPPGVVAAERRNETAEVLGRLEVDLHFMNLPDPGNVADTASVWTSWDADSLRQRLRTLVTLFRPAIVLLTRDRDGGPESPLWQATVSLLAGDLFAGRDRKTAGRGVSPPDPSPWRPERLWVDDGSKGGSSMPGAALHPGFGRRFKEFTAGLDTVYASQRLQRGQRTEPATYRLLFPARTARPKTLTDRLTIRVPSELRSLDGTITRYARDVRRGRLPRRTLQERMVAVMDSVDVAIATARDRTGESMRVLIDWKGTLELLRNALLGVTVRYTLTEDILTARQLTYVRIHEVAGRGEGGTTEVYFPSVDKGWILNESLKNRLPLEVPGEYRLISPEAVTPDLPWAENNLNQPVPVRPVMLFLLHKGRTRPESFVYRVPLPIRYAPRFTVEVLTPIVRCIPGEYLVVRMTNHSRDGVRDFLTVEDSLVRASGKTFRLNTKDESVLDTLHLTWRDSIPDGMYVVPLTISDIDVARFGARRFSVGVDTTVRIGLLTGPGRSSAEDALRRLGLTQVRLFRDPSAAAMGAEAIDVLVVDRRANLALGRPSEIKGAITAVTRRGGHVVLLGQDAAAWNRNPLWDGVALRRDPTLAPGVRLTLDTLDRMLTQPNVIREDAFEEWLFGVGTHKVTAGNIPGVSMPVRASNGRPLVVSAPQESGRITYVDLLLEPQMMSIHPGAFRILANILSYGREGRNE